MTTVPLTEHMTSFMRGQFLNIFRNLSAHFGVGFFEVLELGYLPDKEVRAADPVRRIVR